MPVNEATNLQESFRVFNQVTRSLERAYSRLEDRAAGVDGRLSAANGRLLNKVSELKSVTGELNGILDAIPCGVVACDGEGTITRLNPAAERIIGRPSHEVSGRDARTLLDHRGTSILLLGRSEVRSGTVVERLVCCLDGSERFLSGSVADLPDGGRLEILSDQTEVAHLRSQVTRLDTLAELGEMAAGVAHEIRNPMNGVEGFAGLLAKALRGEGESLEGIEAASKSQLLRYADRIRKGVAEVNGIISNLLLWARPERARMDPVTVSALLGEVAAAAEEPTGMPRAAVEVVDHTSGTEIECDRLKLKLALGNLVRNGMEATGEDGRVMIGARREGNRLRITVDDDGPGIPTDLRGRLFRPFTTTKAEGTGLGLALSRKFVELHGGSIIAETAPIGGARLTVVLPIRSPGVTS